MAHCRVPFQKVQGHDLHKTQNPDFQDSGCAATQCEFITSYTEIMYSADKMTANMRLCFGCKRVFTARIITPVTFRFISGSLASLEVAAHYTSSLITASFVLKNCCFCMETWCRGGGRLLQLLQRHLCVCVFQPAYIMLQCYLACVYLKTTRCKMINVTM